MVTGDLVVMAIMLLPQPSIIRRVCGAEVMEFTLQTVTTTEFGSCTSTILAHSFQLVILALNLRINRHRSPHSRLRSPRVSRVVSRRRNPPVNRLVSLLVNPRDSLLHNLHLSLFVFLLASRHHNPQDSLPEDLQANPLASLLANLRPYQPASQVLSPLCSPPASQCPDRRLSRPVNRYQGLLLNQRKAPLRSLSRLRLVSRPASLREDPLGSLHGSPRASLPLSPLGSPLGNLPGNPPVNPPDDLLLNLRVNQRVSLPYSQR